MLPSKGREVPLDRPLVKRNIQSSAEKVMRAPESAGEIVGAHSRHLRRRDVTQSVKRVLQNA